MTGTGRLPGGTVGVATAAGGRTIWRAVCWFIPLFLIVTTLQAFDGAYERDLATHADEAAYFVSAVCVLDYVTTAFGTDPVAFAETFYVRYPKLAFGHWPPAFFAMQAVWYWLSGATAGTAMLLVGIISTCAALAVFLRLHRVFGMWIALLALAVFVTLPLVRAGMSLLMADTLASLLMFLAVAATSDACFTGRVGHWVTAAVWGLFAMLTKESALLLLVFAPVAAAVLGSGSRESGATRRLWGAFAAVVVLLLVTYALTGVLDLRGLPRFANPSDIWNRSRFLATFAGSIPLAVWAIVSVGAAAALRVGNIDDRSRETRAALLWLALVLVFQVVSRDSIERRYFLPAVFPLMIVFAHGLGRLSLWSAGLTRRLAGGSGFRASTVAGCVAAFTAGVAVASMTPPTRTHRSGYAPVAASIPDDPAGSVILVSSDPSGEGALIAERLSRDHVRQDVVLRASKVLASSDWMGSRYQLLATTPREVRDLLDAIPVRFVVIDMHGFINRSARTNHRLLEQSVMEASDQFQLIGEFPLVIDAQRRDGAVQVYENLAARGRRPDVIRISMSETLGRTLELRLGAPGTADAAQRSLDERRGPFHAAVMSVPRILARLVSVPASVETRFQIRPQSDTVDAEGANGQIYVSGNAAPGIAPHSSVPWISVTPTGSIAGDTVVRYTVSRNNSNHWRSGGVVLGGVTYRVDQMPPPYIQVPFDDDFDALPLRWVLEGDPRRSVVTLAAEGLDGGSALVLSKRAREESPWHTQVYLPALKAAPDVHYQFSVWMKADPPGQVLLAFSQRREPFEECGLRQPVTVQSVWTEFTVDFQGGAPGCGHEINRLSIAAGELSGRLWMDRVSVRAAPGPPVAESRP